MNNKQYAVVQLEDIFSKNISHQRLEEIYMETCHIFGWHDDTGTEPIINLLEYHFQDIDDKERVQLVNWYFTKHKDCFNIEASETDDEEVQYIICKPQIITLEVILLLYGHYIPKYSSRVMNIEYLNILKWHLSENEYIRNNITWHSYKNPIP